MAQMRPQPRWPAQPQVRPNAAQAASSFPSMQAPFRSATRPPAAAPTSGSMRAMTSAGVRPMGSSGGAVVRAAPVSVSAQGPRAAPQPAPTYKYTQNMRNPGAPNQV